MTTCQIAAATGNGSRARGRNRIASSGGLTYGPDALGRRRDVERLSLVQAGPGVVVQAGVREGVGGEVEHHRLQADGQPEQRDDDEGIAQQAASARRQRHRFGGQHPGTIRRVRARARRDGRGVRVANSYPREWPGSGARLHRPCASPWPCTCSRSWPGSPSRPCFPTPPTPIPSTTWTSRASSPRGTASTSTSSGSSPRSAARSRANPVLPIPSNAHWMPLASIVQVPFIWLLGPTAMASALPFALFGALAAPLAWAIGRDAGAPRSVVDRRRHPDRVPGPVVRVHGPARQLLALPAAGRRLAVAGRRAASGATRATSSSPGCSPASPRCRATTACSCWP